MKLRQKITRGFSLVEVVVAIGLVALLLVGVMGLMAPAARDIDRSLSKTEAKNMTEALMAEMNTLREFKSDGDIWADVDPSSNNDLEIKVKDPAGGASPLKRDVNSAFEKALVWMNKSSVNKSNAVLIYKYSGKVNGTLNKDGSLEIHNRGTPTDAAKNTQGQDYIITSVARLASNPITQKELKSGVVSGKVYLAKFKGYKRTNKGLELLGTKKDDYPDGDFVLETESGFDIYGEEGLVAAQLEIYALKANTWNYVNGAMNIDKLGKPVYTVNVAFNR